MAKTLKKIVYGTLMELQSYTKQYDKFPDEMYWIDKVNTWRAATVRDLGDVRAFPMAFYQTIKRLPLVRLSDTTHINNVPVTVYDDVFFAELPELIGDSYKEIFFLGTDKGFSRRSWTSFTHNEGNLNSHYMPMYTLGDGGVYIRNLPTPSTQFLKVVAIFAHPHLVPDYDYERDNYPISEKVLPKIEYLLKREVFQYLGIAAPQEEEKKDEE